MLAIWHFSHQFRLHGLDFSRQLSTVGVIYILLSFVQSAHVYIILSEGINIYIFLVLFVIDGQKLLTWLAGIFERKNDADPVSLTFNIAVDFFLFVIIKTISV